MDIKEMFWGIITIFTLLIATIDDFNLNPAGYENIDSDQFQAEVLDFLDEPNVWHEGIVPFRVDEIDFENKILSIEVDDELTNGSDGACMAFGLVMNNILEQLPTGWRVYVTNDWVPSKFNPITLEWSRELAKGY